jgi:CRP/FNR family transcriptional regulator, cyclic AMP receptor protein
MSRNYDTNEFDGIPGLNTGHEGYVTSPGVALTYEDKLLLLKSIALMKNMSERTIQGLAEFLKPRKVPDGVVVFEEESRGMSMYFVASGRIRIYKQTASGATRELAIVGPGDFFGEMALVDEVPRSASAAASGACVLFEFYSGDLARWVKNSAPQALQFFSELSHVLAKRLRKTSRELTLHFDLSNLLGDHQKKAPDFLREALERVISHLEGQWSAAAYLPAGASTMIVQWPGYRFEDAEALLMGNTNTGGSWLDDDTFRFGLDRNGMALGCVVFRSLSPLLRAERDDVELTLTSACNPITTGLEIIALRT